MKKILMASLAFAAILTSCVKEEGTGTFDGTNTVTFELPIKNAVTYATAGTTDENSIGGGVAVYMFNDNAFEQAFKPGDTGYSLNGNKLTVSVDGSGTRDFYIVANINNVTLPVNPTLAQLKNLVSNVPALNAGKYHAINPANASDYILMSAPATGISITEPTSTTVKLVRRMARFDVKKEGATLNVSNVLISNANVDGDVFAGASGNTYTKGSIEPIALTFSGDKAEGAFYLYPTELGDGKTVISFETSEGVYVVNTSKTIEANKLYTITIEDGDPSSDKPEFILDTEDWGDGGNDITTEPGTVAEGIVGSPSVGGDANFDENTLTVDAEKGATLEVVTKSALATPTVTVTGTGSSAVSVQSETAVPTYSSAYFTQKHKITVAPGYTEIDAKVTIASLSFDVKREAGVEGAVPTYPGTELKAVKIGDLFWAPVNVGATVINSDIWDVTTLGYLYQWGRNIPFLPETQTDCTAGPVAPEQGASISNFITAPTSGLLDWQSPQDVTLWSSVNNQGPCPTGWRLPSRMELTYLALTKNSMIINAERGHTTITGDDGISELYLQWVGTISRNDGKLILSKEQGRYNSYDAILVSDTGVDRYTIWKFFTNITKTNVGHDSGGHAASVRCVKDAV